MPPLDTKNSIANGQTFPNNQTNQPSINPQQATIVPPKNSEIRKDILLGEDLYKKEIDPVFQSKSSIKTNLTPFSKISPGVYSVLKNQEYVSSQPLVNKVQNPPINQFAKSIPTTPAVKPIIRTFRSDVESAIKVDHWSSVNIAMAENERMRAQEKNNVVQTKQTNTKKTTLIVVAAILLVVIGAGVFILPSLFNNTPKEVVSNIKPYSLITPEYTQEINVDNILQTSFASSLGEKIKSLNTPINAVQELYFTQGQGLNKLLLSSSDFTTWGDLNIPDQLIRTLNPEYMLGVYSYGANFPFLIFKTTSFENTYAGMIAWEANMRGGLSTIFSLPATEQTINQKIGLDKFTDMVIQNKDTRVLKDANGKVFLLYSIIDKTTIVITVNEQSFKEILSRINREKSLAR